MVFAVAARCFFATVLDAGGAQADAQLATTFDESTRTELTVGRPSPSPDARAFPPRAGLVGRVASSLHGGGDESIHRSQDTAGRFDPDEVTRPRLDVRPGARDAVGTLLPALGGIGLSSARRTGP